MNKKIQPEGFFFCKIPYAGKAGNEESMKKFFENKRNLTIVIVIAVLAVMGILYAVFGNKTEAGSKSVTVAVVDDQGAKTEYSCKTDSEYLLDVMKELEADGFTFEGDEGDYGLMVSTVNGVRADYTLDGAYWYFYVNGEACMNGVSTEPVHDGDAFEIVYTKAE